MKYTSGWRELAWIVSLVFWAIAGERHGWFSTDWWCLVFLYHCGVIAHRCVLKEMLLNDKNKLGNG